MSEYRRPGSSFGHGFGFGCGMIAATLVALALLVLIGLWGRNHFKSPSAPEVKTTEFRK